jgi:hypothetical protein
MNFKRLFEVCWRTPGTWTVTKSGHPHFDVCIITEKDGGSICHFTPWSKAKNTAIIMSKSPELLKALIEQTIFIETVATSEGKAKNPDYSVIKLIESVLSSPEKPITWEEIKEILESDA